MKQLSVDGIPLEAFSIDGAPPTLVFLHAGLGAASSWVDLPRRLNEATGRATLAYSRPGYGRSGDTEWSAGFLEREAARLGEILAGPSLLIGHSDGGSIALIRAATGDERVVGVVAIAPHVMVEDVCVDRIRADAREIDALRDRLMAVHGRRGESLFEAWTRVWTSDEFRRFDIRGRLASIACPVLVVQGRDDPYGTLQQVDEIMSRVPGASSLVLDDCAHVPQREKPRETFDAIVEFVRAHG